MKKLIICGACLCIACYSSQASAAGFEVENGLDGIDDDTMIHLNNVINDTDKTRVIAGMSGKQHHAATRNLSSSRRARRERAEGVLENIRELETLLDIEQHPGFDRNRTDRLTENSEDIEDILTELHYTLQGIKLEKAVQLAPAKNELQLDCSYLKTDLKARRKILEVFAETDEEEPDARTYRVDKRHGRRLDKLSDTTWRNDEQIVTELKQLAQNLKRFFEDTYKVSIEKKSSQAPAATTPDEDTVVGDSLETLE